MTLSARTNHQIDSTFAIGELIGESDRRLAGQRVDDARSVSGSCFDFEPALTLIGPRFLQLFQPGEKRLIDWMLPERSEFSALERSEEHTSELQSPC